MLLLTHKLREYDRLVRSGAWQRGGQFCLLDFPIRELLGRKLGVVGYGVLGKGVAHAAHQALGMEILVANRPGGVRVPGRLDLAELLPHVDVLSLHCPLTPETARHDRPVATACDAPRCAAHQHGARWPRRFQCARDALRAGTIGGAAIDVLPQEPPVDGNPLLDPEIPNLIVTPHIAWAAREARQRCLDEMAANIGDYLRGGHRGRVV